MEIAKSQITIGLGSYYTTYYSRLGINETPETLRLGNRTYTRGERKHIYQLDKDACPLYLTRFVSPGRKNIVLYEFDEYQKIL
jgi:hypothetical protein